MALSCLLILTHFGYSQELEDEPEFVEYEDLEQSRINYELSNFMSNALEVYKQALWRNNLCYENDSVTISVLGVIGDSILKGPLTLPFQTSVFCNEDSIKIELARLLNVKSINPFLAVDVDQQTYNYAKLLIDNRKGNLIVQDSSNHFSTTFFTNIIENKTNFSLDTNNRFSTVNIELYMPVYGLKIKSISSYSYELGQLSSNKIRVVYKYDNSKDSTVEYYSYTYENSKLIRLEHQKRVKSRLAVTNYKYDDMSRLLEITNLFTSKGRLNCTFSYDKDELIANVSVIGVRKPYNTVTVIYKSNEN